MPDETTGRRLDLSRERHLGDITEEEQRSFDSGAEHRLAEERNRETIEEIALWNEESGASLEKYKMLSKKIEDAYEDGIIGAGQAKIKLKGLTREYEESGKGAVKWWTSPNYNLPDPKDAAKLLKEVVLGLRRDFYFDSSDLSRWRHQFAVMKKSMPRLEKAMGTDDDEFLKIEADVNALGEAIEKEEDHFLQGVKEVVSELDEREELNDDQSDFRQELRWYLDMKNNENRMRFNPAKRRIMMPAPSGNLQLEDAVQSSLRKPARNQGARATRAASSFSPANYRIRL